MMQGLLCVLYLEYAEEQDDAEHHHEELRADSCAVGHLHSCNKKRPSLVEQNRPITRQVTE
jgi:hypothetical protein